MQAKPVYTTVELAFLSRYIAFSNERIEQRLINLVNTLKKPETGVEIRDRTIMFKTYHECFVARELVTKICMILNIERHQAVRVGIFLGNHGFIEHVTNDHIMKDENLLFRFIDRTHSRFSPMSPRRSPGKSSFDEANYAIVRGDTILNDLFAKRASIRKEISTSSEENRDIVVTIKGTRIPSLLLFLSDSNQGIKAITTSK
jgi:hypothetical protein